LSITLDLSKPEGVAVAKRLVGISDAVVENFTPRVMANWGLDYPGLKETRPDLIMLSMSTMGQTGPWRDYVGFGPTVQAFSGITHLTSLPGRPPAGLGFSYADHVAGLFACLALLGALECRRKTGEGQFIDISQVEAMSSLLGGAIMENTAGGCGVEAVGNSSKEAAPHGVYRCQGDDRWCAIAVRSDEDWQGFCRALGEPVWAEDEMFTTLSGRLENAGELDRLVEGWTMGHTAEEVMALLQQNGVAAGVVQDAGDLAKDPQLKARGFFIGPDKAVSDAVPFKLSDAPTEYARSAPVTGQDNNYVYGELLAMSEGEIAGLKQQGIIS